MKKKGKGRKRKQKASTCGTAVGAKQGRTKGNEQRSKYENQDEMHEKSGWKEWGSVEVRTDTTTGQATERQKQKVRKGETES